MIHDVAFPAFGGAASPAAAGFLQQCHLLPLVCEQAARADPGHARADDSDAQAHGAAAIAARRRVAWSVMSRRWAGVRRVALRTCMMVRGFLASMVS